ncbi:MAG: hypothetical protein U1G07_17480 [Verrucomicrobiota bacterium]
MMHPYSRGRQIGRAVQGFLLGLACLSGCARQGNGVLQGYIEGEFVYVASPFGGAPTNPAVQRGAPVKKRATFSSVLDRARKWPPARKRRGAWARRAPA